MVDVAGTIVMPIQLIGAGGVAVLVMAALTSANFLRDRGVDPSVTRHLAGAFGGVLFLVVALSLDASVAVALSAGVGLLMFALRLGFRGALRGVASNDMRGRWGEIVYPFAGAASLA